MLGDGDFRWTLFRDGNSGPCRAGRCRGLVGVERPRRLRRRNDQARSSPTTPAMRCRFHRVIDRDADVAGMLDHKRQVAEVNACVMMICVARAHLMHVDRRTPRLRRLVGGRNISRPAILSGRSQRPEFPTPQKNGAHQKTCLVAQTQSFPRSEKANNTKAWAFYSSHRPAKIPP